MGTSRFPLPRHGSRTAPELGLSPHAPHTPSTLPPLEPGLHSIHTSAAPGFDDMDLDEDGRQMATAALSSHSENGRSMSIDDASGSIGYAAVESAAGDSKPPIKRRAPIACRRFDHSCKLTRAAPAELD